MTPLLLAVLMGVSLAVAVWALRNEIETRWHQDVRWLEHTVWRFTPDPFDGRPYVAAYYAFAIITLIVIMWVMPSKLMAIIIWFILVILPKALINRAWEKRKKLVHEQLPGAVTRMSSSVAAGMSLIQAIERLAEREPEPINTEFRVIASYWKLGSDLNSTIEEAKRRLDLQDFNLFASAILINQKMGGNIVVTLDRLANALESIARMRREVLAATAEGRQNIKVLAFAPFVMLGFIAVIDARAVGMLFTTPLGNVLLGVAILLVLAGTLWAWKIINADI